MSLSLLLSNLVFVVVVVVVDAVGFGCCRCRHWFYCRWFRMSLSLLLSECYSVADVGVVTGDSVVGCGYRWRCCCRTVVVVDAGEKIEIRRFVSAMG